MEKSNLLPVHAAGRMALSILITLALVLLSYAPRFAQAGPASPYPFTVEQPDGTEITLFIRGSEFDHWNEDPEGFAVVPVEGPRNKTRYMYGKPNAAGDDLVPAALEVGKGNPRTKGLRPKDLPKNKKKKNINNSGGNNKTDTDTPVALNRRSAERRAITKGNVGNLVVMVRWADHAARTLPTVADLNILFNNNGPNTLAPTGSVRDVWLKNSYNALNITSSFSGWVTVNVTETQAAGGASGMSTTIWPGLVNALEKLDATVDFRTFDTDKDTNIDMITFIHSGYMAELGGIDAFNRSYTDRIWSHKWSIPKWKSAEGVYVSSYHLSSVLWGRSGSEIGRIGVIAHETGHFLGLPDLYDTDNAGGIGSGIGSWGLMANSWGFDASQRYPPHLSAWSKIAMGYVTPTLITQSGVYTAQASERTAQVFKIAQGFPDGEYLLIENRQPIDFDAKMGTGGLLIYHINDGRGDYSTQGWPGQAGWPENGNHYRVAVLQADGLFQLESTTQRGDNGDLWRVGGKTVLSPTTVPNTKTYQGGKIKDSGITITVLSEPGMSMQFRVNFANCDDGIQNQDEAGVDCGGTACAAKPCTCANQATLAGVTCAAPLFLNTTRACTGSSGANPCSAPTCCTSTTCGVQSISCASVSSTGVSGGGMVVNSNLNCIPGSTCTPAFCCGSLCSVRGPDTACNDTNEDTDKDTCQTDGVCRGTPVTATCGYKVLSCRSGYYVDKLAICTAGMNCTQDACCKPSCTTLNAGASCNDWDASTVNDTCTAQGNCAGTPATCGNQKGTAFSDCPAPLILAPNRLCTPGANCTVSACCATFCALAGPGSACNDSNLATSNDTCTAGGLCVGTVATCASQQGEFGGCGNDILQEQKACTPNQTCTAKLCCATKCANVSANLGRACDDGNPGTIDDKCTSAGTCAGTPATCANQLESYGPCPTNKLLNASKQCKLGVDCSLSNCCIDFCALSSNAGLPCDDGNAATIDDQCVNSQCVGALATCGGTSSTYSGCPSGNLALEQKLCVPGSSCTRSTCCVAFCATNPVGTACDDGNTSTINDKCQTGGVCAGVVATCSNTNIVCAAGMGVVVNKACTPGKDCSTANCCQPATCGTATTVTCATGYTKTASKACTGTTCNTTNCCQPATCGTAAVSCQSVGGSLQTAKACEYGVTCTPAMCCSAATVDSIAPTSTCGTATSVTCPAGYAKLSTKSCSGSTCTIANCCSPGCGVAKPTCSTGTWLNTAKTCTGTGCTATACCVSTSTTCGVANPTCAAGYTLQTTKACKYGTDCTAATCCAPGCGVAKPTCATGTWLNTAKTCTGTACTSATCCVSTSTTCGVANPICASGYTVQTTKACKYGTDCTAATCCAPGCGVAKPTCATGTWLNTAKTCTGTGCTAASCCVSTATTCSVANPTCLPGFSLSTTKACKYGTDCTTANCCAAVATTCGASKVACTTATTAVIAAKACTGSACSAANCCTTIIRVRTVTIAPALVSGSYALQATVTVENGSGALVTTAAATVKGTLTATGITAQALTGQTTTATSRTTITGTTRWASSGLVPATRKFCVTAITATGFVFVPNLAKDCSV